MNKKNISPNPHKPIERISAGQLPEALAELSETALTPNGSEILPNYHTIHHVLGNDGLWHDRDVWNPATQHVYGWGGYSACRDDLWW